MPGKEEYLELGEIRDQGLGLGPARQHQGAHPRLNRIRRENPALWDFRNIDSTTPGTIRSCPMRKLTPRARTTASSSLVNLDPQNRAGMRPTRCRCGSSACPTTLPSRSRTCSTAAGSRCTASRSASRSIRASARSRSGASSRRGAPRHERVMIATAEPIDARPLVQRRASSTSCTSRRSSMPTTTASATSRA